MGCEGRGQHPQTGRSAGATGVCGTAHGRQALAVPAVSRRVAGSTPGPVRRNFIKFRATAAGPDRTAGVADGARCAAPPPGPLPPGQVAVQCGAQPRQRRAGRCQGVGRVWAGCGQGVAGVKVERCAIMSAQWPCSARCSCASSYGFSSVQGVPGTGFPFFSLFFLFFLAAAVPCAAGGLLVFA